MGLFPLSINQFQKYSSCNIKEIQPWLSNVLKFSYIKYMLLDAYKIIG